MTTPQLNDAALEGQILQGVFTVEEKIGRGGTAWVYRGRHSRMGIPVAIKILFSSIAAEPNASRRFLREARIQYEMHHTGVVRVLDFIEEGGITGFVLEWCDRGDLEDWFQAQQGQLPLHQFLGFFLPVLDALESAHQQGIIHRDLKPQNILLRQTEQGLQAKLTDFGIAKVLEEEPLTKTGTLMGTLHYMAPEQLLDTKRVDQRADIYSLGIILYYLLTGKHPYNGKATVLFYKILNEALPEPLDAPELFRPILYKCLHKDPEQRYASCRELRQAIEAILPQLPQNHTFPFRAALSVTLSSEPLNQVPPSGELTPYTSPNNETPSVPISPSSSSVQPATPANPLGSTTPNAAIPLPSTQPTRERFFFLGGFAIALLFAVVLVIILRFNTNTAPTQNNAPPAKTKATLVQKQPTTNTKVAFLNQAKNLPPTSKRPISPLPITKKQVPTSPPPPKQARRTSKAPKPSKKSTKKRYPPTTVSKHVALPRRVTLPKRKASLHKHRSKPRLPKRIPIPYWAKPKPRSPKRYETFAISLIEMHDIARLIARNKANKAESRRLYETSCKLGYGPGCSSLAWLYPLGDDRRRKLFYKGCQLKSPYSCIQLGLLHIGDRLETRKYRDMDAACQSFIQGCKYKWGWGCRLVNVHKCMDPPIRGVRGNRTMNIPAHKTRTHITKLIPEAFGRLGKMLYQKRSTRREARTLDILQRGCRLYDGRSCTILSDIYDKSKSIEKNFRYLHKGCHYLDGRACYNLGNAHDNDHSTLVRFKNRPLACYAFRRGCRVKDSSSCSRYRYLKCDEILPPKKR